MAIDKNTTKYRRYIEALCKVASQLPPEINRVYPMKADQFYEDRAVRSLVLAYRNALVDLDAYYSQVFTTMQTNEHSFCHIMRPCTDMSEHYFFAIRHIFESDMIEVLL